MIQLSAQPLTLSPFLHVPFSIIYSGSSPSAHSLSLYLPPHSSFKAVTSVFHPYLLYHLLALCPFSICLSVFFYLFSSPTAKLSLSIIYFSALTFPCPLFFYIDFFHRLLVFHSHSHSGLFIAPINFSAYELRLLSSSFNFPTLSLFPSVSVRSTGGRADSVLDGKKNAEEG